LLFGQNPPFHRRKGQGLRIVSVSTDSVCRVEKPALENSSVSLRRSTFQVSFLGFMEKRPRNRTTAPKLSVANTLNNEGDFSSFEFPADLSTKETYEKRCTGKLSAANYKSIDGQKRPWNFPNSFLPLDSVCPYNHGEKGMFIHA